MKLTILSRGPYLYSTRRLASVARRRGHRVEILDPLETSISIAQDGRTRIYEREREVETPDVVIPRIGASVTYYGLAVLRQFELMGARSLNGSEAIERSRDKLRCTQLLSTKGIAMPDTAFSSRPHHQGALDDVGQGPLVIKLLHGTQGKGVLLADSKAAATSIIDAFHHLDEHILVQRFVAESAGRDVRAFVVGKQVVASMERQASRAGEFRSNLHLGGTARRLPKIRAIERLAVRATRALGLDVAGVDILISKDGPLILEVNASPGLEGIEKTTGVNVTGAIVDYIEERYSTGGRRRRLRA